MSREGATDRPQLKKLGRERASFSPLDTVNDAKSAKNVASELQELFFFNLPWPDTQTKNSAN